LNPEGSLKLMNVSHDQHETSNPGDDRPTDPAAVAHSTAASDEHAAAAGGGRGGDGDRVE
jgi:hypothetical protein